MLLMVRRSLLVLLLLTGAARADIIVLTSDDKGAIGAVAVALQNAYGGRIELHNLAGSALEPDIADTIRASAVKQVVAVGLMAAQLARRSLDNKQVVFCQVLSVDQFKLVTPWMKGVSGIPSLTRQFAAWKVLDPNLRKIGMITGQHSRYMVDEAQAAARGLGLEIEHVAVTSERAVMSALQELRDKRVGGLWLAPDSTILSQRAILDLMAWSASHNLPVLAFSPALLKEGALLSATADNGEIASLALERLRKAAASDTVPGDPLVPLQEAHITVSAAAAARFGLAISPRLKELADVQ